MSSEQFKTDLETADRKQAARQKLAQILEFRLGKTHNNQAIINDIDTAGLLDSEMDKCTGSSIAKGCAHESDSRVRVISFGGIQIEAIRCIKCGQSAYRERGYRWTDSVSELIGDDGK